MNKIVGFARTPAGQVLILAAVAAVGLLYTRRAVASVESAAQAVNPLNDNNVIYNGVNQVGEKLSGKPFNLGHWIYDLVNKKED